MTLTAPHSARALAGAVALAFALLAGQPAFAQNADGPPPVPNLNAQPEPPASQLAAARDVVEASGMARSFDPMVPQLMKQIAPIVTRTRPELGPDLNAVLTDLRPEFLKDGDEMVDIAAHVYAQHMSEQELKDTATFFNSPIGKKYVEVQPKMLDQLVVAMQSWTQKMSLTMMTRVREEMVKKGHKDF